MITMKVLHGDGIETVFFLDEYEVPLPLSFDSVLPVCKIIVYSASAPSLALFCMARVRRVAAARNALSLTAKSMKDFCPFRALFGRSSWSARLC